MSTAQRHSEARPRSSRIAKKKEAPPARLASNTDDLEVRSSRWSQKEKEGLLSGIKQHGSRNLKKLLSYVPGRTEADVKVIVAKLKRCQNYVRCNRNLDVGAGADVLAAELPGDIKRRPIVAPIEKWILSLEKQQTSKNQAEPCSVVVPQVLSWISQFEDHPTNSQVNFGAIYETLAALTAGEAPPKLDSASAKMLLEVTQRLKTHALKKVPQQNQLADHLRTWLTHAARSGVGAGIGPDALDPFQVPKEITIDTSD